jgi:hypothetical protein
MNQEEKQLFFYFYYDGEISDELFDLASCVATEASAAFPANFSSHEEIVRWDVPKKLPLDQGRCAYRRRE